MSRLFKRFRSDITGLLWLSMGIFLSLALVSYNPDDPSFNAIGAASKVSNYCGLFGSYLADIIYQSLGLASWVLVAAALRMAFMGFRGIPLQMTRLRWLWAALLVVTASSLGQLYLAELKFFSDQILVGGVLGLVVSSSLVKVFNFAGVGVLLWTSAFVL